MAEEAAAGGAVVVGEAEACGVSDVMHGGGVPEPTSSNLLVAMIFTGSQERLKPV